ncbi:hypothetical protein UFOVP251_52 [uncultured Caudovirales phage]|uniref:Uncharacterized protein n=1 Tax=uncultured Caudovirales phage TaxID=2100421 RepID=A0A6J5LI58_9CAUD|nr:hypothetical protein UFOVP251_52 [uncultured Caudovirales phage]
MSTTVNNTYGSYIPAYPTYINSYGVTITQYGVISGTSSIASLLMETGSYILQENGGKIGLG